MADEVGLLSELWALAANISRSPPTHRPRAPPVDPGSLDDRAVVRPTDHFAGCPIKERGAPSSSMMGKEQ